MTTRRRFLGLGASAVLAGGAVAAFDRPDPTDRASGDGRATGDGGASGSARQATRDGQGSATDSGATTGTPDATALVAGSLVGVAGDVPGAGVEAHGSLAVRRLITEGAREPDAVALADPTLFTGLVDAVELFATNALVVAYAPGSERADAIGEDWSRALTADGVRIGRTDPGTDPLGYRTVLALKLAERRGLTDRSAVLDRSTIMPETGVVQAVAGGKLDAAFVYRSMAAEADIPYVDLPAAIDFSDPAHADTYGQVSLDLGERTVHGAPISYAAAATTDAGEPWIDALVTDGDRLEAHGFTVPSHYPKTVATDELDANER